MDSTSLLIRGIRETEVIPSCKMGVSVQHFLKAFRFKQMKQSTNKNKNTFIRAARLREPSAEESFLDLFKEEA